ncbi:Divinyl chlorophyllide a 8-vinyl-reductase [Hibiscus syriacus]|uniref:Divinyl chlorophyllide a 8-vinyl-reductase n=1 Tax=Hibiscus syriacus TaxID=106335 RepID=A0A6A2XDE2_HIBSY|nr:Divinyl chlorophyllide a 8-vinyl-reductase [Hibiscus syriacus]
MSLCLSFNAFTLHSPKSQTHKPHFSSQFINQIQVKPAPFTSKSRLFYIERFKLIRALATKPVEAAVSASFRSKSPKDINVLVVGSTGYIGKFVVKELVNRGRSGGVKDSWKIDYETTKNSLVAGKKFGASKFVLLSAICVQKPLLEFQQAKLKFEAELMNVAEEDRFTYSIVRPTAFLKSLGAQVVLVKYGKPYVMFGDGKLCDCKPISEQDLASFIADCVSNEDKINRVLLIGGLGFAL